MSRDIEKFEAAKRVAESTWIATKERLLPVLEELTSILRKVRAGETHNTKFKLPSSKLDLADLSVQVVAQCLIHQYLENEGSPVNSHIKAQASLIECRCPQNRSSSFCPAGCAFRLIFGKLATTLQVHSPGTLHSHELPSLNTAYRREKIIGGLQRVPGIFEELLLQAQLGREQGLQPAALKQGLRGVLVKNDSNGLLSDREIDTFAGPYTRASTREQDLGPLAQRLEELYKGYHRIRTIETASGTYMRAIVWVVAQEFGHLDQSAIREWTLDTTFNSNRERLDLLGCCVRDTDGHIVPVAFALFSGPDEDNFTWILLQVRELLPSLRPLVHKTDGEKAIFNSAVKVFGGYVKQCVWHHSMCLARWQGRKGQTHTSEDSLTPLSPALEGVRLQVKEVLKSRPDNKFRDMFSVVEDSTSSTMLRAATDALLLNLNATEKAYVQKMNLEQHTKFSTFVLGTANDTSGDMESTFSSIKSIKLVDAGDASASDLPFLFQQHFAESILKRKDAIDATAKRALMGFKKRELTDPHWPEDFPAFVQRFTPGVQVKLIDAYDRRRGSLGPMTPDAGLLAMKAMYERFATPEERIKAIARGDPNLAGPRIGLELAIRWMSNLDLIQPTSVLPVKVGPQLVEFVLVFGDIGSFCTCGTALQSGIPCIEMVTVVFLGFAAFSMSSVAPEHCAMQLAPGPLEEGTICQTPPFGPAVPILGSPYFVRTELLRKGRLDILLGVGRGEIPLPKSGLGNAAASTSVAVPAVVARMNVSSDLARLDAAMERMSSLADTDQKRRALISRLAVFERSSMLKVDKETPPVSGPAPLASKSGSAVKLMPKPALIRCQRKRRPGMPDHLETSKKQKQQKKRTPTEASDKMMTVVALKRLRKSELTQMCVTKGIQLCPSVAWTKANLITVLSSSD
jgi:hypothetical protein